jgi:hypothetical protein
MRTTRTAIAAGAALAALLTAAGNAVADTGTGSTPSGTPSAAPSAGAKAKKAPTGDGARALCKRVPKIDTRINRELKRLNGPATERGSVARLEKRVANSKTAGDTAITTYLNDRLTFRKSLLPTLNQRATDLAGVRTWCAANDNGKQSGGKAK